MLVHPDYHAMKVIPVQEELHPLQIGLKRKWSRKFEAIHDDESSMLFYVTALEQYELSRGLRNTYDLGNFIKQQDIERIKRLQEMLGERLVLIANHIPITRELLIGGEGQESVTFDPEIARLFVFGEYYGGRFTCVETWGEAAKKALAVPQAVYLTDLCLGTDVVREVELWRKHRLRRSPELQLFSS